MFQQFFLVFQLVGILLRMVLLKPFLFCSFGFWWCLLVIGVDVLYTVDPSFGDPFQYIYLLIYQKRNHAFKRLGWEIFIRATNTKNKTFRRNICSFFFLILRLSMICLMRWQDNWDFENNTNIKLLIKWWKKKKTNVTNLFWELIAKDLNLKFSQIILYIKRAKRT